MVWAMLQGGTTVATEITTFGGFDIKVDGSSVLKKSSRSNKNLELLKYFITYRQQKLFPEQIIEALWPQEDLADPRNALRTQIFRLRRNLAAMGLANSDNPEGNIEIIFENGFYKIVIGNDFEIDMKQFEMAVKKAEQIKKEEPDKAIEIYEKAVNLYKGEYLAENPFSEWIFTIRSRFHRQFLQSVLRLLELLKEKKAFEKILSIYEQSVIHEPFEEALHIYFLESLVKLEDYKTALSHYNYITGKMYREMSIRPTPALRNIYRDIVAAGQDEENASITQIEKKFKEEDQVEGALYCDLDYFKTIYNLERRKTLRLGNVVFLGLITIDKNAGICTDIEAQKASKILKEVLFSSLRKGDVFSRLNPAQMVLILTDVIEAHLQLVSKRIIKRFRGRIPSNKFFIKIEFQPVGAEKSFMAQ